MKLALPLLAVSTVVAAEPRHEVSIDPGERTHVIDATLAALTSGYVFPDVATKIEASVRARVKAGAYDKITSPDALARALTVDLQAVSHDKHMHVMYSSEPIPDERPDAPAEAKRAELHEMATATNALFVKVERLEGNIGYLRVDGFLPPEELGPRAAAAMSFLADTDALILDLRSNGGGEPAGVATLVSYFHAPDADVHINDIYARRDGSTRQYWTERDLPGRRYPNKPVYVLTSGRTFSGAEECAYDLQTEKRATIVGEVTGGGANPGEIVKLTDHFGVFVPGGRAINPITHTNWEGTGVKPDVAAPADKALDVAYLAALRQQQKLPKNPHLREQIDRAIGKLTAAHR